MIVTDETSILAYLEDDNRRWNGNTDVGTAVVVTYSFTDTADLPTPEEYAPYSVNSYWAYDEAQRTRFREVAAQYEALSGVVFVEIEGEAMINVFGGDLNGVGGWANYSYATETSTASGNFVNGYSSMDPGDYGYFVLLHELGHAMGLSHPHEGTYTLDPTLDTMTNTVMTYNIASPYATTLGTYDALALQELYGDASLTLDWVVSALSDTSILIEASDRSERVNSAGQDTSVRGFGGADTIHGREGNDTLVGDGGNDHIYASSGNDSVDGGAGRDRMYGGTGNDAMNGGSHDDRMFGDNGNDTMLGGTGNDFMKGGWGVDSLVGHDGNDSLYGDGENDTLNGGSGDDFLVGGTGQDLLLGGTENDELRGNDGGDTLLGADGNDTMRGGNWHDSLAGGNGNDRLFGNDQDDTIEGNAGRDKIFGGNGHDLLFGGGGSDELYADSGWDTVYGGTGGDYLEGGQYYDELFGEAGNDTLVAVADQDTLTGGLGEDTFVLIGDGATVIITDFEDNRDIVHLQDDGLIDLANLTILFSSSQSLTYATAGAYGEIFFENTLAGQITVDDFLIV